MKINPEQMRQVLLLSGPQRYEHFIKVIVDWQEIWGLYKEGWALAGDNDGNTVFPLWPAKEYAGLCAKGIWENYQPKAFNLDDFLDKLLPKLKNDHILPGIFYTPADKGVTPSVDQILADLQAEISKYE